jgi:putative transcriptional regulator
MAILNKVSIMIGKRRTTIAEVARKAGVSYEAVKRLYTGSAKRVDFATLDKLCAVLECDVGDLFEYVTETGDTFQTWK